MFVIKQPSKIIFGKNSVQEFLFPQDCLVITSRGAKSRGWLDKLDIKNLFLFDQVEPNPSLETTQKIISKFKNQAFSRISVLKVNNKKQSFHDDKLISNIAITDSSFLDTTPTTILKNSAIDACAQCTEAFDSKNGNVYTKFFCKKAFDILESALQEKNYDKLAYGSLLTGIGFGNSSTTLGHALSYVYSNEGYSHGHALAFTTQVAHKFNKSKFYERFKKIVEKLNFSPIKISTSLDEAAELILKDRKHLDNNPYLLSKIEIINLLNEINLFQRN